MADIIITLSLFIRGECIKEKVCRIYRKEKIISEWKKVHALKNHEYTIYMHVASGQQSPDFFKRSKRYNDLKRLSESDSGEG